MRASNFSLLRALAAYISAGARCDADAIPVKLCPKQFETVNEFRETIDAFTTKHEASEIIGAFGGLSRITEAAARQMWTSIYMHFRNIPDRLVKYIVATMEHDDKTAVTIGEAKAAIYEINKQKQQLNERGAAAKGA